MKRVIIWTCADMKKVQEVALGIEEIYRSGVRYKISEFISAFGGGTNQTPGKDNDFIIPGPYIDIELFENACSLMNNIVVYVWYKEEDVKMDDARKTLIKEPQEKIEELRCLVDDLVECNKKLEAENRMLLQERRQLTAKVIKLDEESAKEKERIFQTSKNIINNEDGAFFEEAYNSGFISCLKDEIKQLKEANNRLTKMVSGQITKIQCLKDDNATSSEKHNIEIQNAWKTIESKEKSIQALMDQLDARDREIEKYKFMVVHMADDLYGKGDLDRGEEDLEDDCCEK